MKQLVLLPSLFIRNAMFQLKRKRLLIGIATVSVVGTSLKAQDLTPIIDTLWTKQTTQTQWVDFQASSMGGNPRGYVVATQRLEVPRYRFLVEYDITTGQEIRSVKSGHSGDVQHMSFARNANIFTTSEGGQTNTIKVWRWPEMEVVREFRSESRSGYQYRPQAALLTSDGRRLYDTKAGVMYNIETGDTVWKWRQTVVGAWPKITVDDRYLIVHDGSPDFPNQDRGYLLDATTGQVVAAFPGGSGRDAIDAMAVADDGRYVAISRVGGGSPPADGSVYVYDRLQQQTILKKQYPGYDIGGYELAFTPNAIDFW